MDLAKYCLTTLGLEEDVTYRLSKWDPNNKEKYLGDEETWNYVQDMMRDILNHIGIDLPKKTARRLSMALSWISRLKTYTARKIR